MRHAVLLHERHGGGAIEVVPHVPEAGVGEADIAPLQIGDPAVGRFARLAPAFGDKLALLPRRRGDQLAAFGEPAVFQRFEALADFPAYALESSHGAAMEILMLPPKRARR